ncbi:MAG: TonB-dependent receptor [Cycloclasticus sp.]
MSFFAFSVVTPYAVANELSLFNDEIPIVLSATRLAQPQTEAPSSITIIDRKLIKVSGAKSIPELFRLVPGMHVAYYRGNTPVVGYQGLNGENPQGVQVLIDGRSVYSPLFGGVDWSNIPLVIEDIERIEVIRGANGSSFGSNAFQAVVNITTTHAVQSNGFEVKSTVGERGYQRTLLKGGMSFSDIDFRISASHIDDNGYKGNSDDTRQDLLTSRIDYQITSNDNLQVNFGVVNSLKQTHKQGSLTDLFEPLRYVDESNYSLHAKWEHVISNKHQFTTQASYTRHISKDKVTSTFDTADIGLDFSLGNVVSNLNYTNYYDRYDIEFEHQLHLADSIRASWGLGNRNDRISQPYWLGNEHTFDNSIQRVFGNLEWRPSEKFIINAGALWEHSQLSGDHVSPRLAVNYLLTPYHSMRLSVLRATRAPVIADNNYNTDVSLISLDDPGRVLTQPIFRSVSGLDPETVDSLELGYHGLFLNKSLTLDIKLYRNEYNKLIDTTHPDSSPAILTFNNVVIPDPDDLDIDFTTYTYDNLHHANINGFDIEINYRPDSNNLLHAGYAYNHTNVGRVDGNNDIKNILFSVPKDIFNILASHTFDNAYWVSAAFYYTGSIEYLDAGNPVGPMRRLDLNAGKTFNVAEGQTIDVNFTLQLALDKNKDFLKEFTLDNRAFIELSYVIN